jgi:hypothetical protein
MDCEKAMLWEKFSLSAWQKVPNPANLRIPETIGGDTSAVNTGVPESAVFAHEAKPG